MGEEVLKKFGRYFLLDRIAQGGMAEIYRARMGHTDGAGRILVIKRIQSGFNANSEFLQMFKSEIKVTMGFNHPNIVQLYDFGDEQGMPYIAMEFVDGKNARQFGHGFEKNKQKLPVELACYIIEQAALGLNYAHSFKDKITGEPLNIVHRDISPQNILISYDGNIKVIDFGIAKATTNGEATKAGVIKGKPSYLAPEQITGEDLDGRCDIFALGICLWELLCGRKLFAAPGENEYAVLKLIESCTTYVKAPSTVNPAVPKDLDFIVLKALAKQKEKRFQTAEEFAKALKKFLYAHFAEFNPHDLSVWGKNLFKDDIVNDRKKLQRLNSRAEQLLQLELDDGGVALLEESNSPPIERKQEKLFESDELSVVETIAAPSSIASQSKQEIELPPQQSGERRSGSFPPAPDFQPAQVGTAHILTAKSNSGSFKRERFRRPQSSGGGGLVAVFLVVVVLLGVAGAGLFWTRPGKTLIAKFFPSSQPAPVVVNPVAEIPAGDSDDKDKRHVALRIQVTPAVEGLKITLGDKSVDPANPMVKVKLDQPLELHVEKSGFKSVHREFVVRASDVGEMSEWLVEVPLEPLRFGFVTIRTVPSADANIFPTDPNTRTVASEAKPWAVLKTPIDNQKLPIGVYQVRLENKVLGMGKTITLQVEENRVTQIDAQLQVTDH